MCFTITATLLDSEPGGGKELLIRELGDGAIRQTLVPTQAAENFIEIEMVNAGHRKLRLPSVVAPSPQF
jgi:hypothetical protein